MPIDDILADWRAEMALADYPRQKALGDAFERLCIAYLTHEPEQKTQYRKVKPFWEWARNRAMTLTMPVSTWWQKPSIVISPQSSANAMPGARALKNRISIRF